MKIKTSDLIGTALDWAVAKCDGVLRPIGNVLLLDGRLYEVLCGTHEVSDVWHKYSPSTNWAQGGSIIGREKIGIDYYRIPPTPPVWISGIAGTMSTKEGKTPLIAAMRCYVASKLGNEVDIPEELL